MRSLTLSVGLGYGTWFGLALAGSSPTFDWSTVTVSSKLQYQPCYEEFDCARLSVPRDWLNPGNNKTVEIAIVRYPATVPSDDPTFGGSIITNPGGPGGSGVSFMTRGTTLRGGRTLRDMTEGKKHYEIVGFDPRGIENTTPKVDCFGQSHLLARDALGLEMQGIGGLDASESGLKRALALAGGVGDLCEGVDEDEDIMSYVSTASVARDIVEIADRIEELREAEHAAAHGRREAQVPLQQEGKKKNPSRVLYWGFSYGTVLGNTLASMFPGRMGRVILDGVCDIDDYMNAEWSRNLLDTEKIVQYFYDTCYEAGNDCALWKEEDTSSEDIKARIDQLVEDTNKSPVVVSPTDKTSTIRVITGHNIHETFKTPLYAPWQGAFKQLATALAEALNGNYSLISTNQYLEAPLQDACGVEGHSPGDGQTAILCGDARSFDPVEHPRGSNVSYWQDYVNKLQSQSPTIGASWAEIAASCSRWHIPAKWGFTGPWTTPPADPSLREDAPAAPILFTSSRLDPVTPLENAFRMSNGHPGSAVLELDTVGHCAMGNGWSECFNEAIRAYLDDGILPENGTVCADLTCKPFVDGEDCKQGPHGVHSAGDDEAGPEWRGWAHRPLGIPF